MAQQTQIARAAERWAGFIDRFPTFEALAAATPAEVVGAWRGLGYNRRAISLLRAARIVVSEHGGRLPRDLGALERLPGVGPYTARAVAATAFGMPVGAVDTNVGRVLGRLADGRSRSDARRVQVLADALVAPEDPARWTHALMDLGATICVPRKPDCGSCPISAWCRYAREPAAIDAAPIGSPDRTRRPGAVRRSPVPFAATTRWLRGRILDRLRDGPAGARDEAAAAGADPAPGASTGWVTFGDPIGSHSVGSVETALGALAREGLAELRAGSPLEARLPEA
jgi:A/G-specific adenine glycosylase